MYTDKIIGRLFDMVVHQLSIGSVLAGSLLLSSALDQGGGSKSLETPSLNIDLSSFSPAFAAFEDELLFAAEEAAVTEHLMANNSQTMWKFLGGEEDDASVADSLDSVDEGFFAAFDGAAPLGHQASFQPAQPAKGKSPSRSSESRVYAASELRFGPLVASGPLQMAGPAIRPNPTPIALPPKGQALVHQGSAPAASPTTNEGATSVEEKAFQSVESQKKPSLAFESYRIQGNLSLADGLAFFGALEATWMIGNELVGVGSVNTPDATFEIEVTELLGEVFVSLYDNNDQLIGESIIDLADLNPNEQVHRQNLVLKPIDWDHAGEVLHVHTLGQTSGAKSSQVKNIPVSGARIGLYSFNQSTHSRSDGSFRFPNWRKSQSRTLALASHRGFRDSIFILDSKRPAQVPLLSERYLRAFFSTLDDQGLYNQEDRGLIYGSLQGLPDLSGYKVFLRDLKPIYFDGLNMASRSLEATTANGLFAFVGLDDGDYELGVEKDGVIIDHRVLAVEQGKVSPVIVNLQTINKSLQFYNPMNPAETISAVQVSFFDGASTYKLDQKQRLNANLPAGNEPNMIEYAVGAEVNRSFISRNRGFEKLPVMTDDKLLALAKSAGLSLERGLVFAFIDSPVAYRAELAESDGEQVIYFNQKGEKIDPSQEVPFGFVMGNFYQGLNTVRILSATGEVLASDLIFSDHNSIAVMNSYLIDSKPPLESQNP